MPLLLTQHMARDNGEAHPNVRHAHEDPEFGAEEVAAGGEVGGLVGRLGACDAVHGDEICGGVELS